MKKFFIILIPAVLLVAFACHRDRDSRIDFVKNRISSELDLNEDQEARLTDLTNAIREQMKQSRTEPMEELITLLDRPTLDAEQSKAFFEKHMAERTARLHTIYEAVYPKFAAFHASLSEEQRKEALACIEKFHRRWHKE
ncbi:Spy/CpxP family protein refolding chaperone [Oligoflexus tunisiensis]|uniref:Spy/CpxP family protein refolding chaperone n=1 Tax=Oligoflexus tunisiensis TaxID=708132 RepID=UPI00159F06C1|nr:Spy/CpxP family protein refolding chaperone [Oligoflexus tunisiensis]